MGVDTEPRYSVAALGLMHLVGLRGTDTGRNDLVALDLNVSAVHIPQWFREDELVDLPDDPVARATVLELHGFCVDCLGFGVPPARIQESTKIGEQDLTVTCETCGGTGRSSVRLTFDRSKQDVVEASMSIDPDVAGTVRCILCRSALIP